MPPHPSPLPLQPPSPLVAASYAPLSYPNTLPWATQLAEAAGLRPADRFNDHAYVVSAALQSPSTLITHVDFLEVYAAYLRELVVKGVAHPTNRDRPLSGFSIVVNPGNGAGGFFATRVLGPLGADVSASINLAPDGSFPAHIPNPEAREAVAATRAAVLAAGADLGIMLDTDVDRSGVVDAAGGGINRNRYIALMAAIALRESPGETVVTDSCTSNGLAAFIAELGGRHFRYKKGYKNIVDKGIELNEQGVPCPLMMETSGHGAMRVRRRAPMPLPPPPRQQPSSAPQAQPSSNPHVYAAVLTAPTCAPRRALPPLLRRRTTSWTTAPTARSRS